MRTVVVIIENPRHGNRQYKHKFGSRSAIDRYLNHPNRVHLKVISIRQYDEELDKGIPFTLK
ncbi:hypothetical protein I532_03970 [Brevibacillus borstelensis AK1]|uniref:Uncharacterized protein n=1 Tax=Brevibacillus borstelensis AK1 TaxID=1300222 RepID=M8DMN0_9BACL|nr:hypothetical protein [Brevibacillus borstelensis]EMT54732.1 hypothetical protein I532_03970 [Brevibacillus borstelensis AK1]